MSYTIDLGELVTPPHTDSISGREFGKQYALEKKLIEHVDKNEQILLVIDNNTVKAINDSFIKGFFNEIFKKYKLKDVIKKRIEIQSNEYYKRLIDKNWSILEAVYK